ncbi:MAG TPA: zinc ribbon domain-containing protein [Candidatus Bathyarchaeia archaeon]|nr:zinc ribbon domain-containing protein [Candidatus Bathyarchaeia archaeon]
MTYCPMCGTNNEDKYLFCVKCGASLKSFEEKFGGEPTLMTPPPTPYVQNLVKRAFWLWLLLSLFVTSIFYYVYYYFNFEDMNKLNLATPAKEGPSLETDKTTVIIYIVISAIIPIPIFLFILNYWKYKKLNDYIKYNSGKNYTTPVSAGIRLAILIFQYIFTYAILGLTIYLEIYLFGIFEYLYFDPFMPLVLTSQMITIISIISGLSVFSLIFTIFMYVTDAKWQKAFNEQVSIVNPYAQEKIF